MIGWTFWHYKYPDLESARRAYLRWRDWGRSQSSHERFLVMNVIHGNDHLIITGVSGIYRDEPGKSVIRDGQPVDVDPVLLMKCLEHHYQTARTPGFTEKRNTWKTL